MNKPNCRLLPNEIYESLPTMTEAEIKVVMTVWAETFSVGRADVSLSNDELASLSGLSANSVISGVKGCIENHDMIVRKRDGHGFRYALKLGDMESDPLPEKKERAAVPNWTMMVSISKVTGMDLNLNRGRIGAFAKDLLKEGYTAEQVQSIYGEGGVYWTTDWRAKLNARPNTTTIRETIKAYAKTELTSPSAQKFVTASDGGTYV